jgi:hypothetical protein
MVIKLPATGRQRPELAAAADAARLAEEDRARSAQKEQAVEDESSGVTQTIK